MRLIAEDLAGERGGETVFSGVSFALGQGEGLIVTGANGSGKSTLLRVVAGLLPVAAGRVALEGGGEDFPDIASACHYLGHLNAMKPALTVAENLAFWQAQMGAAQMGVAEALDLVDLPHTLHLPYSYLSTGQKRRVSIAKLFLNARPVWIVDEPTAGLDKQSEAAFVSFLGDHLEDGGILIAATHLPLPVKGVRGLVMGAAHG